MKKMELLVATLATSTVLLTGCTTTSAEPSISDLKPLTSTEAEAIYEQTADQAWEYVESQFPDAVRPVSTDLQPTSVDERPIKLAECLSAKGFPSEAQGDGGWTTEAIPKGQEQNFAIADYECRVTHPYDAELNRPATPGQLKWLYWYFTGDLMECLEEQGYQINEKPPSEAAFIEAAQNGTLDWSPYKLLEQQAQADLRDVRSMCPEYPDTYYGG